jgi:hypothetical protein
MSCKFLIGFESVCEHSLGWILDLGPFLPARLF